MKLCSAPAVRPDQTIDLYYAMHTTVSCVNCYISTDCCAFNSFFLHLRMRILDKLSSHLWYSNISIYYDITDFGLFRVRPKVCERPCTVIRGIPDIHFLCLQLEERLTVICLLYNIHRERDLLPPYRTQTKQYWHPYDFVSWESVRYINWLKIMLKKKALKGQVRLQNPKL